MPLSELRLSAVRVVGIVTAVPGTVIWTAKSLLEEAVALNIPMLTTE